MDIEYDPTEEDPDDVQGLLDDRRGRWSLACSEHGAIETAADGSAEAHDALVYRWTSHMQESHHGDGRMSPDDQMMLINRP